MPEPTSRLTAPILSPWRTAMLGAVALFVGLGIARFGYSPLIPALVHARWFTPGVADFLASVNLVGYLIGAVITGTWLAHRAPAPWLRAAMLVASGSLAACSLNWGFAWYAVWRLLAGVAAGVLMVLAVPSILALVPARTRGVVGGLIFGGVGVGMIFSGEAIPALVRLGLPAAWLLLALLGFVLTAIVWSGWSVMAVAPAEVAPPPPLGARRQSMPGGARVRDAGAWAFVWLFAAYCCNAVGFAPHSLFWVDFIARQLSRGLQAGGHDYLLFGIGVTFGPLAAGWLGDRFGVRRSLAAGMVIEALGLALPLWATTTGPLVISSLLVGAAGMGATTLFAARTVELTPPARRTRAWGVMTLAFSSAYAAAAMAFSGIYAHASRYEPIFLIGALALVVGALLAALAR